MFFFFNQFTRSCCPRLRTLSFGRRFLAGVVCGCCPRVRPTCRPSHPSHHPPPPPRQTGSLPPLYQILLFVIISNEHCGAGQRWPFFGESRSRPFDGLGLLYITFQFGYERVQIIIRYLIFFTLHSSFFCRLCSCQVSTSVRLI